MDLKLFFLSFLSYRIQSLVAALFIASADGNPSPYLPATLLFVGFSFVPSCQWEDNIRWSSWSRSLDWLVLQRAFSFRYMVNISLAYFRFWHIDGCIRKVDYGIQGTTPMAIIVYLFSNYEEMARCYPVHVFCTSLKKHAGWFMNMIF